MWVPDSAAVIHFRQPTKSNRLPVPTDRQQHVRQKPISNLRQNERRPDRTSGPASLSVNNIARYLLDLTRGTSNSSRAEAEQPWCGDKRPVPRTAQHEGHQKYISAMVTRSTATHAERLNDVGGRLMSIAGPTSRRRPPPPTATSGQTVNVTAGEVTFRKWLVTSSLPLTFQYNNSTVENYYWNSENATDQRKYTMWFAQRNKVHNVVKAAILGHKTAVNILATAGLTSKMDVSE